MGQVVVEAGDRCAGEAQTRAVEVVLPDDVVDQVVPENRRVGVDRHDGERVGLEVGEGHIDRVANRKPEIGGRILMKGDARRRIGVSQSAADDVGIKVTLNIVDVGREDILVLAINLDGVQTEPVAHDRVELRQGSDLIGDLLGEGDRRIKPTGGRLNEVIGLNGIIERVEEGLGQRGANDTGHADERQADHQGACGGRRAARATGRVALGNLAGDPEKSGEGAPEHGGDRPGE